MRNLKLALRVLLRSPFVTAVAILSLALGIGTNTAIFSMLHSVLLRPLPVEAPRELVNLEAPGPKPGSQSCGMAGNCDVVFSYPMFRDLERNPGPFTGIAGHSASDANIAFKGQASSADILLVSGSYFPVLGLRPAIGRLFTQDDDRTVGSNFVTVLGYGYWQNRLGGDPSVLGSSIIINGQTFTIIGVAPQGFDGTTVGRRPQLYVPLSMRSKLSTWWDQFEERRSYWIYLFARRKPGVSLEQARTAINAIYSPIVNDIEAPLQKGMSDPTMVQFRAKKLVVEDGFRGQSELHNSTRTPLLLLFAITGIVLLTACANIANLLLARAAGRSLEMSVRLSLGATRKHLLTQLLTESLMLSMIGGAVGLLVARGTLLAFSALLPTDSQIFRPELSGTMMWFAAGLSVLTGFVFGLFPAMHSTRPDLMGGIRGNSGQISGARTAARFRTSLATAQIALSMTLLISAGLFLKSLVNVSKIDLGLRPDSLVAFGITPVASGYTPRQAQALFERVETELAAIPGVTGVTATTVRILSGSNWGQDVSVQGIKREPDMDMGSRTTLVGPDYFHTLGAELIAGREFTVADGLGASKVAIVNEAFAKKFKLGSDAVGKFIAEGLSDSLDIEIVGLVRDNKYSDVKDPTPPVFVRPWRQDSLAGGLTFYVRGKVAPTQLLREIPNVMKRIDANLPLEQLMPVPQQIADNTYMDRMISTMASAFATLATLLAAIGLYGVLAYSVAQRTRELGVRMALGASAGTVRVLVLRQVAVMTLIGGLLGIGSAFALGRAARSLLFGLEGYDVATVAGATVLLAMVAFGAGYLPARKASKISPMQALRYE
ncbi:MAG TPA: ABC transporter permease [Gemmatimonadales bacterium]|nr:ABC transporter permease [Gemmatimonadales bacterium]